MISVIIATKNRDAALSGISLPSLLAQDTVDFEVIVWDASDNDKSEKVAENFQGQFNKKGVPLRFFRAPRGGLPSQRNDAVSAVMGNSLIFFIDDDCEVSCDGLSSLEICFHKNPDCMGAGLRITERSLIKQSPPYLLELLKERIYEAFGYVKKRKVHPSGSNKGSTAPCGPAEWLSGGSMAFRREVFDLMSLNEKLEAFGGYAMCEDVEFSHRVFLHYGKPLIVASGGHVVHHEVPEARSSVDENKIAMFFYNRYLVMKVASIRSPVWGRAAYGWNMLKHFLSMAFRHGLSMTRKGFILAVLQIREDRSAERLDKGTQEKR